ncbi:MAG TPA: type 4a pilus biogenesis protein PilO [Candidatus Eisenbacteria bacterium]|jgi:type IV pilus assembly protein PilO|nr:type 4a pilus biogenesis protein PilO [Candidatus Eisenbacteria bacterium]HEU4333352.1 type 4a pilus biogenesis protein PilO [Candidatus Eisenbacteria bacterium]
MDLKDPKTQKIALIVAGIAALVYFYVFADYVPFNYRARAKQIAELKVTYTHKMNELTKAQQLVNRLPELKREFALLNQRWAVAQELLPTQKEVASLLRKVTIAGQESGVKFVLFKPGQPNPTADFTENPVQISVTGGYHRAGTFLSEIAELSRLVNVSQLKVKTYDKGDLDDTVQADFVATAYTLAEGTSNEPAKQPGAAAK